VTTVEQPPGDLLVGDVDAPAFASWGSRVVAALLDSAILTATAFLSGSLADVTWWIQLGTSDETHVLGSVAAVAGVLLLLQALTGATPGKRVVGIRVVRELSGRPPGVLLTLVREVVHVVDAICFLGYLRPLWHARGRTIADSAAATDVVRGRPGPRPAGVDTWTAGAVLVCAVGVGFAVGGTSTNGGYSSTCTTTAVGDVEVEAVDLDWGSVTSSTRLGVTRTSGTSEDLVATWVFASGAVPPDGTELSVTIESGDGDESVTRTGTVVDARLVLDGTTYPGTWTMRFPPADVAATGLDRSWHADVTTPERTVEVCSGEHY